MGSNCHSCAAVSLRLSSKQAPGTKIHDVVASCASSPRQLAVEQSSCPDSRRTVNNFGEFRNEYESIFSAESPAALPVKSTSLAHRVRLSMFRRTKESNWVNNTKEAGTLNASDQNALETECAEVRRVSAIIIWRIWTHNHQGAVFVTTPASANPLSLELDRIASFYRRLRAAFVGLGGRAIARGF